MSLSILITVDTELWCNGWKNLDACFPDALKKYIYGKTPSGEYGLPFLLRVLNDNELKATFFVEPLFALRFGPDSLAEIVGTILDAGQSVELHLHTEWVDEAKSPLFPEINEKRQHIRYFSYDEQVVLLDKASELLRLAGAPKLHAFRAGNFGANFDTLRALSTSNIGIDSSYNSNQPACEIDLNPPIYQAEIVRDILEVPMTIFRDGIGRQRPMQITACSLGELIAILNHAFQEKWQHLVLLTHSAEMLNDSKTRKSSVVVGRFVKFCEYLSKNNERFTTIDFRSPRLRPVDGEFSQLHCGALPTLTRLVEQAWGRLP